MLAPASGRYRRREPETTLLYRVVATQLDPLREELATANPYGKGLPRHVDKELEAYLRCGLLQHGFARVVCRRCHVEHLVGLSCKGRGVCPSCTGRRMHDTAAHLVDRVIPRVSMRQWVVTFPRRVRYHLAADPKLATLALREVLRVLFTFQRRHARKAGARPSRANSSGAVTFIQRFNSALELSLHFHILIPDGVFIRDRPDPDAGPRFVPLDPPTEDDVAALLGRISLKVSALLHRRGRLDDDAVDHEPEPQLRFASSPTAIPGRLQAIPHPLPPLCARKDGFSLHAGAAVHGNDRAALERLCRYGLRPALAAGRLSETTDGQLLYEMKRTFSDGTRTLRFSPRELLLRLCALVPPPGFHMVRYGGILSAHARGRHALTGRGLHHRRPPSGAPTPEGPLTSLPPDDPARARRLDWAALLKRAFAIDVLVCPACQGPMRLVAFIQDPAVARQILEHLGLPARAPPRGAGQRPGQQSLPLACTVPSGRFDGIDPPLLD